MYLDAAAAAADPFHLEMVFSEPFVASTWNTEVVLMPKIVPCGPWMEAKSCKNRFQIDTKSVSEVSTGVLRIFPRKVERQEAEWTRFDRETFEKRAENRASWTPKRNKNRRINRSFFQFFLRSICCSIFVDFGRKNGAEMVVKSMINRCQLRHPIFCKNHGFSLGKTIILMVLGFEVGSENQWKRHGKIVDYTECILAPRFNRFRYVLGGQDGAGMDCQI